ncbi:MAG: hypothetical protein U0528_03200 [Anaerolineae bacterium]|nr:DUF4397 domain-containing protein [Anaerolineae bacterium]
MKPTLLIIVAAALVLIAASPDAAPRPVVAMQATPLATPIPRMRLHQPAIDAAASLAFIWFAHTAVDVGPIDLYVQQYGDTPIVENLAFGKVTPMIVATSGLKTIRARAAGSGLGGEVQFTLVTDIEIGTSWLISLVGRQANRTLRLETLTMLRDDLRDRTRVRIVNYIPDEINVSLISQSGQNFGEPLGWIGIDDVDLPPNTYALAASTAAGTLIEPEMYSFEANMFNLVLLIGSPQGVLPPRFLVINTPQHSANVRFVNNRTAPVDIFMIPGNVQIVSAIQPAQTSDYLQVPSRAVTFTAYAVGTGPTGFQLTSIIDALSPGYDVTITLGADGSMTVTESHFSPAIQAALNP